MVKIPNERDSHDSAPRVRDSTLHILQRPREKSPGGNLSLRQFPLSHRRLPNHQRQILLKTATSIILPIFR